MNQLFFLDPIDDPITESSTQSIQGLWGCDYGSGYFHCFNGRYIKLRPNQFATLDFAADFDTIVIENAHMQQKRRSMAQVFELSELEAIADRAALRNIDIRLWFHSQTPKWRSMLNMGDKSDEVDARTIYQIAQQRGIDDLQYFRPSAAPSNRVLWAHDQIDDMNDILNAARIDYESNKCPAVVLFNKEGRARSLQAAWKMHGTYAPICQDINNFFLGAEAFKQGLSLWAALVSWDGTPRTFNGQQPGVKFIMNELLRQRPNHFRGGVARSNIMYWGFKNSAIKHLGIRSGGKIEKRLHEFTPKQKEKWLQYRRLHRRAMVATLHAMKHYINRQMMV